MYIPKPHDRFYCYEEVVSTIKNLSAETYSKFYIQDSKKIKSDFVKRRVNFPVREELVYYDIKYSCVYGGKYKSNSRGIRKSSTIRNNCPVHILFRIAGRGDFLEVRSCEYEHNHECTPELFSHIQYKRSVLERKREQLKKEKKEAREKDQGEKIQAEKVIKEKRNRKKKDPSLKVEKPEKLAPIIPAYRKSDLVCIFRTKATENAENDCNAVLIDHPKTKELTDTELFIKGEDQTVLEEVIVEAGDDFFGTMSNIEKEEEVSTKESFGLPITQGEIDSAITTIEEGITRNEVEIAPEERDRLHCQFCQKKFTQSFTRRRHERVAHGVMQCMRPPFMGRYIQCVECDIGYRMLKDLRLHLASVHKMSMEEEKYTFPSMNAFREWKKEVERKSESTFILRQSSKRKTRTPKTVHGFICHRSGINRSKAIRVRQRIGRRQGSCKMGINCTAEMVVVDWGADKPVEVKYFPNHYGHGNETSLLELSEVEQRAIKDSLDRGYQYDEILEDFKADPFSKDFFQLYTVKIRDRRFIESVFKQEIAFFGMNEWESLNNWVYQCSSMLEDSPILYSDLDGRQDGYLLIIMSEYQKHIFMNSERHLICVDTNIRKSGGLMHLNIIYVVESNECAFPAAFCISNKSNKQILYQFFSSVKDVIGELSFSFFMSPSEIVYYETWCEVMEDSPKWLFNQWEVESKIQRHMLPFQGKDARKRNEIHQTVRKLMACQNVAVFDSMLNNFIETLKSDQKSLKLGLYVESKFSSNTDCWAYCYRKEIPLTINTHLELLHQIFHFCLKTSRKHRIDKCVFVFMMLVKRKIIDQLLAKQDEALISLAVTFIQSFHVVGLSIPSECITSLKDEIWLVKTDDEEFTSYVTQELKSCPVACSLKCPECDVCVHMFSCSCPQNMINANLCQHIHAVVWKFLVPSFAKVESPIADFSNDVSCDIDIDTNEMTDDATDVMTDVIELPQKFEDGVEEAMHHLTRLYKLLRKKKFQLTNKVVNSVVTRLGECVDMCNDVYVAKTFKDVTTNTIKAEAPDISSIRLDSNNQYFVCSPQTQTHSFLSNNDGKIVGRFFMLSNEEDNQ